MTRDEILNMPAGREMDALIAEKVMGWTYNALGDAWTQTGSAWVGCDKFLPGTDIAAAWEVVEKLKADGFSFDMEIVVHGDPMGDYIISGWRRDDVTTEFTARADTAPLAICRAALLAVME